MDQILGHMGLQMERSRTDGNQQPKSVSTEKMGPQRVIRLKRWCGLLGEKLHDGPTNSVWKIVPSSTGLRKN